MSESLRLAQPRFELQLPNGGVVERPSRSEAYNGTPVGPGTLAVSHEAQLLPASSDTESLMNPEAAALQQRGLDRIARNPKGIDGLVIPEESCSLQEERLTTLQIIKAMHSAGGVLEGEDSFGAMQFVNADIRKSISVDLYD